MNDKLPHDHGVRGREVMDNMPGAEEFRQVSELFSQLADGSRLRLFWVLCHCEECVMNLSSMMGMSSPALSHHLKLLKNADLIVSRREGKEVYYRASDSIEAKTLHIAIEKMIDIVCPQL